MTGEMCEKAVDTYPSMLMHVSNCYKSQKKREKAVDNCPVMLDYVPNFYRTNLKSLSMVELGSGFSFFQGIHVRTDI